MTHNDLIARLRKRANDEREVQKNNEAVAEALAGQMEAFNRNDGSHNTFAVRLGLEHKKCAEHDAKLAADWDEAADALTELLAERDVAQAAIDKMLDDVHEAAQKDMRERIAKILFDEDDRVNVYHLNIVPRKKAVDSE